MRILSASSGTERSISTLSSPCKRWRPSFWISAINLIGSKFGFGLNEIKLGAAHSAVSNTHASLGNKRLQPLAYVLDCLDFVVQNRCEYTNKNIMWSQAQPHEINALSITTAWAIFASLSLFSRSSRQQLHMHVPSECGGYIDQRI